MPPEGVPAGDMWSLLFSLPATRSRDPTRSNVGAGPILSFTLPLRSRPRNEELAATGGWMGAMLSPLELPTRWRLAGTTSDSDGRREDVRLGGCGIVGGGMAGGGWAWGLGTKGGWICLEATRSHCTPANHGCDLISWDPLEPRRFSGSIVISRMSKSRHWGVSSFGYCTQEGEGRGNPGQQGGQRGLRGRAEGSGGRRGQRVKKGARERLADG